MGFFWSYWRYLMLWDYKNSRKLQLHIITFLFIVSVSTHVYKFVVSGQFCLVSVVFGCTNVVLSARKCISLQMDRGATENVGGNLIFSVFTRAWLHYLDSNKTNNVWWQMACQVCKQFCERLCWETHESPTLCLHSTCYTVSTQLMLALLMLIICPISGQFRSYLRHISRTYPRSQWLP